MRSFDMSDTSFLPEAEAYFAGISGNLEEAVKIQTQVVERNPLNSSALGTLAFYLLHGDRLEESLALFRQELQRNPHANKNHALIGVALALLGRGEEASSAIAEERHEGYRLWAFAIAHWASGRQDESAAALKSLTEKFSKSSGYHIAQLYALQGKKSQALEWLTRACVERQSGCELIKIDRFFRDLRDEPRYKALLVKMKLSDDPPR
jgi:tetratricopeptide (TPR) repeat protein